MVATSSSEYSLKYNKIIRLNSLKFLDCVHPATQNDNTEFSQVFLSVK